MDKHFHQQLMLKRASCGLTLLAGFLFAGVVYAQAITSAGPAPVAAPEGEVRITTPQPLTSDAGDAIKQTPIQLTDPQAYGTIEDPAFQNMTSKMFPLTPDQIEALRGVYESTQRSIAQAGASVPRPMVSTQTVSLSPGSTPPIIRLGTGYVSSVVFVDETGSPWPITAYNIGDPERFNIQWDQEGNLLMIQGQGPYAMGNMAVTLKDLNTPIMLTLVNDQRIVDYRLDFRVQGRGPNANSGIIGNSIPQNSNVVLMNLLDGVPPQDAQPLEVVGGAASAWLKGSTMLVRTPLTLLSPSWQATMTSPDGTKVYQMNPTPLLLVSDRGRSVTLKVKGM